MAFPSTFVDLQNEVIGAIGLEATGDLAKVRDWINQAYTDVCIETESTGAYATGTLTAGSPTYSLPTEVLRIKEILVQANGTTFYAPPLCQEPMVKILQWRLDSATGTPTTYALFGYTQLEFYPTPDAADTILVYYIARPTPLSADADVPILQEPYASYCVKYGAMAEAANFLKDPSEQEYRALFDLWMKKYKAHLNRRAGGHTIQLPVAGMGDYLLPHDNSTDVPWRFR